MDESSELDRLLEVVLIEEAICYLGFGEFAHPGLGPVPAYRLFDSDVHSVEATAERQNGRYDLAIEWLWRNLKTGKVKMYGVRSDHAVGDARLIPLEVFSSDQPQLEFDSEWWVSVPDTDIEIKELVLPWTEVQAISLAVAPPSKSRESADSSADSDNHDRRPNSQPQLRTYGRGGRPPKYNWAEFTKEVVTIANTPDGLPERSLLTKRMAQWCEDHWGEQPAESLLRQKVSEIYPG